MSRQPDIDWDTIELELHERVRQETSDLGGRSLGLAVVICLVGLFWLGAGIGIGMWIG